MLFPVGAKGEARAVAVFLDYYQSHFGMTMNFAVLFRLSRFQKLVLCMQKLKDQKLSRRWEKLFAAELRYSGIVLHSHPP